MAESTGPILLAGAITLGNQSIVNGKPVNWRVVMATPILALIMAGVEKPLPKLATGLSYIALITILFTRVDPAVPSPTESFVTWWEGGKP